MRGQAVVETSLFLLVFVTIAIFAIHFAEIGWMTVKVQESANSALWDATSQQMHDTFTGDWDKYKNAIQFGQNQANAKYGGKTYLGVRTKRQAIDTRCENIPQISLFASKPANAAIPDKETGMACTAKVTLEGYQFPRMFLQQADKGFFGIEQRKRSYSICAAGYQDPGSGECHGRYVIELDDWGFSGPKERKECALAFDGASGCDNTGYFNLVNATYKAQVNQEGDAFSTESTRLAQDVVGQSPLQDDENHFYLSFRGSDSTTGTPYTEDLKQSHFDTKWETTPYDARSEYQQYSGKRDGCWLGLDCKK
jgi:hypothetical protein